MDIAPWSVYYGELRLSIDGWSYRSIEEHDPLHFPVFDAIEYNMKAFNLMLEEEDDATESSSDGMALQRLKAWKEGWLY
ncbi:hypothetical protein NC652_010266 [Populus alba x Populus x berolinensis]|nr:hypothetical protein NC652_010266 [Populus alba x Populus x berolinensis]